MELKLPSKTQPIATERLLLRRMHEEDIPHLFRLRSDPAAMGYLDRPLLYNLNEARAMLKVVHESEALQTAYQWAIIRKIDEAFLGTAGYYRISESNFKTEIGYMILPEFWRLGFGSEAIMALIQFGFESIGFHRIEADINPANEASIRICKKLGFKQEAHLRQNFYFEGRFIDTVIMGLLKEEWVEMRQNK